MTLDIPFSYYIAVAICLVLALEAITTVHRSWSIPALTIYLTTALWYFTEVFYTPDRLIKFDKLILEQGYYQVCIFLIVFRILIPSLTRKIAHKSSQFTAVSSIRLDPFRLLQILMVTWIILLIIGASLMNWDFAQALFPQGGRWSPKLWSRGAVGSGGDFLISIAGYIYTLVCAIFGVVLFFQRKLSSKLINFILILISWPSFYLSGSRNSFLAVALPAYMTYILMSRQSWWVKIITSIGLFVLVNYLLLIVISFRNTGINAYFEGNVSLSSAAIHEGLNMAEELFTINSFFEKGQLTLQYGLDYFAEALNIIPRFILPDKPLIGHEYNLLRAPNGVINATISAGFIGRGVLNFGTWFGPIAPAILMATWAGFLARLWEQRNSILRLSLFLVGLGITPNLGRDITLLVLWPMLFGYFLVRYIENMQQSRNKLNNGNYQSEKEAHSETN